MSLSPTIAKAPANTVAPAPYQFQKIDYKMSYDILVEVNYETEVKLEKTELKLEETEDKLEETKRELFKLKQLLSDTKQDLEDTNFTLVDTEWELADTQNELTDTKKELAEFNQNHISLPPPSVPSNGPSPEALARLNQFKLDNFSLLETDFNRVSLERALLEQENKALKAEISQIDFLNTPQDSFDMELQRLQQIAYAKYTALAKTSNNKLETDQALLESSALCAAKQTYHAFIDHPEELDDW